MVAWGDPPRQAPKATVVVGGLPGLRASLSSPALPGFTILRCCLLASGWVEEPALLGQGRGGDLEPRSWMDDLGPPLLTTCQL